MARLFSIPFYSECKFRFFPARRNSPTATVSAMASVMVAAIERKPSKSVSTTSNQMALSDTSGLNGQADCATALDRNVQLARQLGVNGTPTIFYADGTRTTGYVPGAEIERRLASAIAGDLPAAQSRTVTQVRPQ